jgi:hypothetical protein
MGPTGGGRAAPNLGGGGRLTQLINLLRLAPDIQEEIPSLEVPAGRQSLSERTRRRLTESLLWTDQRVMWQALRSER